MFAVTAAVLLAVVTPVAWLWLADGSRPPAFETTARRPQRVSGAVHIPVEVHNTGNRTAADVQATMAGPDGRSLAVQRIGYLSGDEKAIVIFILPEPRRGLTFSVTGFQPPS
ncbi:hypothetical protein [Streptomyces radiopugnans]|uniref:hypothetical protein n=1 Tax=Streptomyces radiopugnans TaxID=403935 RepID=UPI003F1A57AD